MNGGYNPDFVVKPGETIKESLGALGMTQAELAKRMGRPKKTVNEIISAKAEITPETAIQLERVFGVPASFWNSLEKGYREGLARRKERKRLEGFRGWLKQIPVKDLVKAGWIKPFKEKGDQVRELLNFYGVNSPTQWEQIWKNTGIAFRKSKAFESDPGAVSAWLRKGEIEGQKISCELFDEGRFSENLKKIRGLIREPAEVFEPEMKRLCAESGVALVFTPEIRGSRVSGATRWLTPTKALIQLSLRHKTDDHFWFSFFHEAGHILKHGKREVFIEESKNDGNGKMFTELHQKDEKEKEADCFSADFLIPEKQFRIFVEKKDFLWNSVREFAKQIEVSPGVIVGRLQFEGLIAWNQLNGLKTKFQWVEKN